MILSIIKKIADWFSHDSRVAEQLNSLFTQGNLLEHLSAGRFHVIEGANLCFAYVRNVETGAEFLVDWMTPAGTIRHEVADRWKLLQAAAKEPAPQPPLRQAPPLDDTRLLVV